jgi:hypothetical protein
MIVLYGPPGVGKSVLAMQLFKAIAVHHGWDQSPQGIYKWAPNANFQDGLDHTQWGILMDDVDQGVAAPTAGMLSHVESIVQLVNDTPFPVEQAAVERKGKIFARPRVLIYCTNFYDARAPEYSFAPHSCYRRFALHVTVGVKEEFRAPGEKKLSPALAADSKHHDIFTLGVRLYKESTKLDHFLGNEEQWTLSKLLVTVHTLIENGYARHAQLMNHLSKVGPSCPTCGLGSSRACGCISAEVTPQGFMETVTAAAGLAITARMAYRLACPSGPTWQQTLLQSVAPYAPLLLIAPGAFFLLRKTTESVLQSRDIGTDMIPESWVRADQTFKKGVPGYGPATWTKDDLLRAVAESTYAVRGTGAMFAMAVAPNAVLIPTHAIFTGSERVNTLTLTKDGKVLTVDCREGTYRVLRNPEMCILKVHNLKGGLTLGKKLVMAEDLSISSYDEALLVREGDIRVMHENLIVTSPTGDKILRVTAGTKDGDCGMMYLVRHGTRWYAAAMHYSLLNVTTAAGSSSYSLGAIVTQIEINAVLASLGTVPADLVATTHSFTPQSAEIQLSGLGPRSELWAAMTNGASPWTFGEMSPKLPGSTNRTKLRNSMISEDFVDVARDWCGEDGYWRFPEFRGKRADTISTWASPFTNAFVTENTANPDPFLMRVALADYLHGCDKLDTEGYAVLSDEMVMSGVAGSYVGAVNMKTSVGPPFAKGKAHFMTCSAEEGSFLSPEIILRIQEIESILDAGDVPCPLGLCTLKDEAVKPGKVPRVFICLSFPYNFVLKKYGMWKSFMRANTTFFESAVGINMTSAEAQSVLKHLDRIPDGYYYDGDIKAMDKSWNGPIFDSVAEAIYAISFVIGVEPMKNLLLVQGLKNTIYSIKNDLFRMPMNPSGCDCTVELNGIAVSLCERYVYYRTHGFKGDRSEVDAWYSTFLTNPIPRFEGLTFRNDVSLIHYGDDNIKKTRLLFPDDYIRIWKDELGFVMTDANKREVFAPIERSEISFLKRIFVWAPWADRYVTPLDLKSIARTIMIKKDTSLSDIDHAATVATEAMRELVYHGPELYTLMRARFDAAAEKFGISRNGYYKSFPFEYWADKVRTTNFRTWEVDPLQPVPLDGTLSFHYDVNHSEDGH